MRVRDSAVVMKIFYLLSGKFLFFTSLIIFFKFYSPWYLVKPFIETTFNEYGDKEAEEYYKF